MTSPREWRFVILAALAILAVTCLPYLYGAHLAPSGTRFIWAVGFLPDTLGNLMFSRQAADGRLLFSNLFTAEPHPARLFSPFFLLVGWLQALTGAFPPLVLQAFRLAAGLALAGAVYLLCSRLFAIPAERKTAFLAVLLTGGPGFLSLLHPFFHRAADVRGAEMATFFSLYQQAHFTAALALIVLSTLALLRAAEERSLRWAAIAGALYFGLVSVHPYDAAVPAIAALAWAILRRALSPTGGAGRSFPLLPLAVFLLFPLPLVLYDAWVVGYVPVFREFAREGLVSKPWPAFDYILGWIFALPFAVAGLAAIFRRREAAWMFPAAWVLVTPLLLFLPIPASRRQLEGFHLFLTLVAFRGVMTLNPFATRARRALLTAGMVLAGLSSVYIMARDMYSLDVASRPERRQIHMEDGTLIFPFHGSADRLFAGSPWLGGLYTNGADGYFVSKDLLAALAWMRTGLGPDDAVLCSHETGLLVPVFSGRRVVTGHFGETLNFRSKNLAVRAFSDEVISSQSRKLLLEMLGARAFLWEPRMEQPDGWEPGGSSWGQPAWKSGGFVVYRVTSRSRGDDYQERRYRAEISCAMFKADGIARIAAGDYPGAVLCFKLALQARPAEPSVKPLLASALGKAPK